MKRFPFLGIATCIALLATTHIATAADVSGLTPRTKLQTQQRDLTAVPPRQNITGRIFIKFEDDAKVRAKTDGRVLSRANRDMQPLDRVVDRYNLNLIPALERSEQRLETLQQKIATRSNKAQPDFAGMTYAEVPQENMLEAIRALDALDIVEFVEFERVIVTKGQDPMCGDPEGSCCEANGSPFCDDMSCCQTVCEIDPFCCAEDDAEIGEWDIVCSNYARLLCQQACPECDCPECEEDDDMDGTDGDNDDVSPCVCQAPVLNGGCFDAHNLPGCNDGDCCDEVCAEPEFAICCQSIWDQTCVSAATELCISPDGGPTPDFSLEGLNVQQQNTFQTAPIEWQDQAGGYSGNGLNLSGLTAFADDVIEQLQLDVDNLTRGKTIRVGVVEHSAYLNNGINDGHEDLQNIIVEEGQTLVQLEQGIISANHGTATLGEIVAEKNGFGVTGIAHEAQGYFFPIVSQEGGRLIRAVVSALEVFEPGDVLNFSIGPGGCGSLATNGSSWMLLRAATDAGVTCAISAGNDCCNLDDAGQFMSMDSGAIIVGASTAGVLNDGDLNPFELDDGFLGGILKFYCRLGFSNHCQDCEPEEGIVHCSAWGHNVTTCGYGSLFAGDGSPNRTYTRTFNGTSSAAPMIAGLAANLQGLAKMVYGIPVPPEGLRDVIAGNGFFQCGFPNPEDLPGSPDENPCGGDFSFEDDPRLIGRFPAAADVGAAVVASPFFDFDSDVTDIKVITGDLLFGNVNAIRANDGLRLQIESEFEEPGSQGLGTGGEQPLTRLGSGQLTDLEVQAIIPDPQSIQTLGVGVDLNVNHDPTVHLIYVYDWEFGFFRIEDVAVSPFADGDDGDDDDDDPDIFLQAIVANAPNVVRDSDGLVLVRLVSIGLGADIPPYLIQYDFVTIAVSSEPGADPFDDN